MRDYQDVGGLKVDRTLYDFVADEVLPGTGIAADTFWAGFGKLVGEYSPLIRAQLQIRDDLQEKIDSYHVGHRGRPFDPVDYEKFLREIGYLVPEPADFSIATENVDDGDCSGAGPQLVVPVSNARYVLNAANARWGSLYEALYGTDAISSADGGERGKGYNKIRGARGRRLGPRISRCLGATRRREPQRCHSLSRRGRQAGRHAGEWRGSRTEKPGAISGPIAATLAVPSAILLRNNGLHIEIVIDPTSRTGADDLAGVSDIVIEAALTAIMDLEDSVAAVDAADKVVLYRNLLGLMQGTFSATVEKNGKTVERRLAADRSYVQPDGAELSLPGRSLVLVRNVGHHMMTDAVLDARWGANSRDVNRCGGDHADSLSTISVQRASATARRAPSISSSRKCTGRKKSRWRIVSLGRSRIFSACRVTRSRWALWMKSGAPAPI